MFLIPLTLHYSYKVDGIYTEVFLNKTIICYSKFAIDQNCEI